jgi:hypothetical protein
MPAIQQLIIWVYWIQHGQFIHQANGHVIIGLYRGFGLKLIRSQAAADEHEMEMQTVVPERVT